MHAYSAHGVGTCQTVERISKYFRKSPSNFLSELLKALFVLSFMVLFAACTPGNGEPVYSHSVGGTVSGLTGSGLVLLNNGGDDLSVSADGSFTFSTKVTDGNAYAVTVGTQPAGQSCTISNASGTIGGANVTNIVVECHASGSLDATFGTGGIVTTPVGESISGKAHALGIQSDGRIVAAGGSSSNGNDYVFTLMRYNTDGSLDTTFGTGGIVTTPVGSDSFAYALGIQPDGRIVAAGYSYNGSNYVFALVRYNANGSLDTTFGTGGIVTTPVGSIGLAYALGIQSDGGIVVAGDSSDGSNYDFGIVRYNANGSLDTTFGTGGIVITPVGSSQDYARTLGIQSDGRIVVAGDSANGSRIDFALVRYNANGSLDTTFGTGGIVTTPVGSEEAYINAVGIQPDGRIVASGSYWNGSIYNSALTRYNANGSLDTTFGTGGKVTTPLGSYDNFTNALGIQSDGGIVAAGDCWNGSDFDFALVRYNTDGSLDTNFGTGGIVTTNIGSFEYAYAIGIQSDGKLVAAGKAHNGGIYDFALVRYWP